MNKEGKVAIVALRLIGSLWFYSCIVWLVFENVCGDKLEFRAISNFDHFFDRFDWCHNAIIDSKCVRYIRTGKIHRTILTCISNPECGAEYIQIVCHEMRANDRRNWEAKELTFSYRFGSVREANTHSAASAPQMARQITSYTNHSFTKTLFVRVANWAFNCRLIISHCVFSPISGM